MRAQVILVVLLMLPLTTSVEEDKEVRFQAAFLIGRRVRRTMECWWLATAFQYGWRLNNAGRIDRFSARFEKRGQALALRKGSGEPCFWLESQAFALSTTAAIGVPRIMQETAQTVGDLP
jgi:hypothetical protein